MRACLLLGVALTLVCSHPVFAGIVMTGTRVIYPADAREKSVQLSNTGTRPYIVQMQMDDGRPGDGQASDAFVLTPPIFRMEPGAGQSVRLRYVGKALPQDRESLFYLSFTQLPAATTAEQSGNQLVLAVTNRVKVFWRPRGLTDDAEAIARGLTLRLSGNTFHVSNPSGRFASVRRASLVVNGREIRLAESAMVAPKSTAEWRPSAPVSGLRGARLRLVLVNDYGSDVVTERVL
ncbi:molecular chaperone [Pluralibacter gergoviae]|nr:molecular chaperone [Pluralibacter gergoviae]KMK01904.1 molecular chaperone [Pluralibacter gergoviae]KMK22703.1 molecular chaperone [Pluralibacter gergoviae]SUB73837.1 Chaperone protein fimC precursor [Pluralibacter gergoviae]HDS1116739.1 molecular chaperone [Pluralibacter gergoviae]